MKKPEFSPVLVILLLIPLFASVVHAETVQLQDNVTEILDDTQVWESLPNDNYGDSTAIAAGEGASGNAVASYIKFNISSIPSGATIRDARIFLYIYSNLYDSAETANTSIYKLDNLTWDENVVTWNDRPTAGNLLDYDDSMDGNGEGYWLSFDVTSWVNTTHISGDSNVSFFWNGTLDYDANDRLLAYSKDYTISSSERLFMNATYNTTPGIEPTFSSFVGPTDPSTYTSGVVYEFNITTCDDDGASNLDEVVFEWNSVNTTVQDFNTINNSCREYSYNASDVAAGVYTWKWFANNSFGKNATPQSDSFTIDKANPTMSTSVTSPITRGSAADYSGSESNSGDADCSYSLRRNGTEIDTGSSVSDTTTLAGGTYNYSYGIYTECQNYTTGYDEVALQVNKLFPILTISNSTHSINTSDLAGYWRLETTSALDMSGYDNDGTVTGTTLVDGRMGNALEFDGSDDHVNASNASSLNVGSSDFSVEFWMKQHPENGTGSQTLVDKYYDPNGWTIYLGAGQIETYFYDGTNDVSGGPTSGNISDNEWHHVVITLNSTTTAIYIDGTFDNEFDASAIGDLNSTTDFVIGTDSETLSTYFAGVLDEVKLWKRDLNASEILLLNGTRVSYGTQTSFSYTESNSGDADLTYNFYQNETSKSTPDTSTYAAGSYYYTVNTTGGENWTERGIAIPLDIEKVAPIITNTTIDVTGLGGEPTLTLIISITDPDGLADLKNCTYGANSDTSITSGTAVISTNNSLEHSQNVVCYDNNGLNDTYLVD
ncbi:LamG-like jellyroll fold domain-containing protein [Candidatus Poribacteria bacterium]